ncbi:putative SWR1-complex protein 5/Craniofacial development protein [Helianthus annuus]|nr:putative SWR1-complex protein 5/Craniofacial development protein [Helianthus annuus]
MVLRLVLGEQVVTVVCAYAPQVGLGAQEKREFWDCLDAVVRAIPREEKIFIGGDFNGHIGKDSDGFELVHGGFGFGDRNDPGRDLLDFAAAHDLGIINSFFRKRESHLITFSSGGRNTQIDYLLMRQEDRRMWMDCKVIPRETATAQHHLLVADIAIKLRLTEGERKTRPRTRWGDLKGEKITLFRDKVNSMTSMQQGDDTNRMWEEMATTITTVANETLGVTTGKTNGHKESWWWNEDVHAKIKAKQQSFRDLLRCTVEEERLRVREIYKKAKREAKKAVTEAKNTAYKQMYERLETKEGEHDMFKISKARERRRQDLGVVKFIKGEDGSVLVKAHDIKLRWQTYFHNLFNGGRAYQQDSSNPRNQRRQQNNCYCRRITHEEVRMALKKMGRGKAVGLDNIPIEVWKCLGEEGVRCGGVVSWCRYTRTEEMLNVVGTIEESNC